jgi:4-hydroxybutyrate dehydrogenase/sulfolactaldehyde 3-reductase
MTTIGFIGLGRMGRPMAANLQTKGFDLVVFDVASEPVKILVGLGARAAADVADIGRSCDIVLTMLPSSVEVEATVLGPDGILANGRAGQLIIDMSTIDPADTIKVGKALAAKGLSLVDAPVGRLASHADRGECLFMVGGSDADVARATPLLEAMGTTIYHCGEVGTGGKTKLVNNYLAIVSCQLNAEALALSQAFGLNLSKTLEVIFGTSATNGQLKLNWSNKVLAGDISPGFTIDLAHKDLSLIVGAAQTVKVPLPVASISREMFSLARARDYGGKDFSGMGDFLCELAGVEKPRVWPSNS